MCQQCGARVEASARVCTNCHALLPLDETEGVFIAGATIARPSSRIVLDKKLGEGGMATVWRAWEFFPPTDPRAAQPRLCALKIMRGSRLLELRAFFTREADALAKLSHPNIVTLYECFDHDGRVMLSIEYVEGETLDSLIARHGARARLAGSSLVGLPLPRAWHYFQQLLGALAAAHAIGLVHRDVKPQNVLLRADGIVKLTDFGIATQATTTAQASGPSNAVGTGAFMSPEQVLSRPVDGRSDLYSAAIVLYLMLSGRLPFPTDDRSEFAVRQDQVEKAPPPIRTWLPGAPPVIDALFARALAKDPTARFADAIDMGTTFRVALGLPDSDEWRAQAEIAHAARTGTLSMPARKERERTLRELIVARYRTAPMPVRR